MNSDDLLVKLKPWRDRNARPAWRPVTIDGDGARTASKFSGVAWLAASERWPSCLECHSPMPLFLQLNVSEIPSAARAQYGEGLLQLFYCTSCDGGWEAFSRVSLVRMLPQSVLAQSLGITPVHVAFPVKRISGWQQFTDYPHPPDQDALGLVLEYDFKAKPTTTRVICQEPGLVAGGFLENDLAERISIAEPGDKLGGWPLWIQGAEYPNCPTCQAQMQMLFQLDSNDNLDFMFGDVGTGHITQCPVHRDVVTFGWACS